MSHILSLQKIHSNSKDLIPTAGSNSQLLTYLNFSSTYQQSLTLQNLNLHSQIQSLSASNAILSNSLIQNRKKSISSQQQMLKDYQRVEKQLKQRRNSICILKNQSKLADSRVKSREWELQMERDRFQTELKEITIKINMREIEIAEILKYKEDKIKQLQERIKIYQNHNKKLQQQNRNLKITQKELQLLKKSNAKNSQTLKQANTNIPIQKSQLQSQVRKSLQYKISQLEQKNRILQQQANKLAEQIKRKDDFIRDVARNRSENQIQLKKQLEESRKIKGKQGQREQQVQDSQGSEEIGNRNQLEYNEDNINHNQMIYQLAKGEGIIGSIITLRNGINKQIFQIFLASLKQANNNRSNSISIFIQKWRTVQIARIQPYINSYFQAIQSLLQYASSPQFQAHPLYQKICAILPLSILSISHFQALSPQIYQKSPAVYQVYANLYSNRHDNDEKDNKIDFNKDSISKNRPKAKKTSNKVKGSKKGENEAQRKYQSRSSLNKWIIDTISFTNNQYEVSQTSLKSSLVYLFRLLTIQYRISYPLLKQAHVQQQQRQQEQLQQKVDEDVWHCLKHYIAIGVRQVIRHC